MSGIKKKFFMCIMLLLCSIGIDASNAYLLITQKNGQQTGFSLIDYPKVDCLSGYLTVTSVLSTISIPLEDILKFEFVNEIPSGIVTLKYKSDNIKVKSGRVFINSLPPKSIVDVYDINGTLLSSTQSDDDGCIELELSQSINPVIIKMQSRSVKIFNK